MAATHTAYEKMDVSEYRRADFAYGDTIERLSDVIEKLAELKADLAKKTDDADWDQVGTLVGCTNNIIEQADRLSVLKVW